MNECYGQYFECRDVTPLFVIPHEKERENVEEIFSEDASIVFITTPGQVLKYLLVILQAPNI